MEAYIIKKIRAMPLMASLKMEGNVKWRGVKLQGPLYLEVRKSLLVH